MKKLTKWKNHINDIQKQLIENSPDGFLPIAPAQSILNIYERLNIVDLFTSYFGYMPNKIVQNRIDIPKARYSFLEHFKEQLNNHIYSLYFSKENYDEGKPRTKHLFFFLYEDLIVHFDVYYENIEYVFHKTEIAKVEEIITKLSEYFIVKEDESRIHLLTLGSDGIETKDMKLSRPQLDIVSNYNDDFLLVHQTIFERLNQEENKGLVMLHGKPGTGKTSYLRFLATSLKKKIIFLPTDMATTITEPRFIRLLMDNRNSILVIEDAEKIIIDRNTEGHSPVSTLLNLADGLLSDCLNIQIICSFNTDLSRVDQALMRKGRLIAKYEFKELEIHKAQQLSDKLGFKTTIAKPMTLADIYSQGDSAYGQLDNMSPIGFKMGKTG